MNPSSDLPGMPLRPLGRTSLVVSRLGLGLAALGRPGYINLGHAQDLGGDYDVTAMAERTASMLDLAWEAGVRYFDAARSYGRAEEFLAGWLRRRQVDPAALTVGSKWGYTYTAGWRVDAAQHEVKDHSVAVLRRQFAASRALLGTHLDLYQIHSATLDSGVLDDRAVLAELVRLRAAGLAIGLTLSGPQQTDTLQRALEIHVDGVRLFDVVQATWNLLEPSAGSSLEAAHALGVGVIIKEALANGRLTARNSDPTFAAQRAVLEELAAQLHTTSEALAVAAVLAQPWVDVVLSGAATAAQLRSHLSALQVSCDPDRIAPLQRLVEAPAAYWAIRRRLSWN